MESQFKLIDAAIEAGVKRFFPSEYVYPEQTLSRDISSADTLWFRYGFDNADPKSVWLSPVFKIKNEVASYLEEKVKENNNFSWTAVATGIWLEW